MYSTLLLAFTLVTLILSLAYFYIFTRQQERFMQFWGFAWVAYSISLLFLLLYLSKNNNLFLEMRKVIDMFNILLLLFGVYAFMHTHIPNYWYRFSLYLLLLSGVCVVYNFDLLSFYLPISIYQISITFVICYYIFRYWSIPRLEKSIAIVAFALWGIGKPLLSILELYSSSTYNIYITELILSNILNFCILTVYAQNATRQIELRDSLYKNVVENAKDIIFYYKLKPYKCFQYISPSITPLTGYTQQSFYKNPRQYINLVTPEFIDEIEDVFSGDLSYEKGHIFRIITLNGDGFWGEINTSVIEGKRGEPIAIECILRDITEMKSAQLEQIRAKESRDLLLSYISHELRTPVTSIAGYLTALSDGIISEEDDVSEAMDIITSKTIMLKTLIDDLDQLSKLETNHFSFNFMICEAKELADILVNDYISDVEVSKFTFIVNNYSKKLKGQWIVADEARIKQVFSNLINNAKKYSNEGTEIFIHFDIDAESQMLVTSVSDSGLGISEKEIPHIFERFYRAKNATTTLRSGRGLGLTLSMEIMKAHKGDLTVESVESQGSTFTFIIPLFREGRNG